MPFHFSGLTQFLAVYGALLASIGFGWNLYRDLLDRARLKVSVHVRRFAKGTDGKIFFIKPDLAIEGASEQLYIVITVVNIGRRPVFWQGWGGKYYTPVGGKGSFSIVGRELPKMLKEGEYHNDWTTLEPDLSPLNDNVKSLLIWDAAGKEWKLSRKKLKALKKETRDFQAPSQQ